MKKSQIKTHLKSYLTWRIVFGIMFIIFAMIALARFNATAALAYILISVFVFIPGRIFKINNKWIKIGIVVGAVLLVGLFNTISGQNISEYKLGEEFVIPNNPEYSMTITKTVKESSIYWNNTEYGTEGYFLLVYFNITPPIEEHQPMNYIINLIDSEGNQYDPVFDITSTQHLNELKEGESFFLYNLENSTQGLTISFADEKVKNLVFVDLEI